MSTRPHDDAGLCRNQSQVINFEPGSQEIKAVRIGVISDTHIPDRGLHIPQVVLDEFKRVDLVLHAGDIVNMGTIDELKSACPRVIVVAGNMDHEPVKKKYPQKLLLNILDYRIGLTHGAGAPGGLLELVRESFKEEDCDIIIFGHSHKALNERIEGTLYFNPGTATDASAEYNSFGIIELKKVPHLSCPVNGVSAKIIKI